MQLNTREWGTGDRVALLVHGLMSDSRTWRLVGPALAERGYRVLAVDLRGHGDSPRAATGEYDSALLAEDLVETLPAGAELAIGHSLGGLALSLAVDRLNPRRAVYSDPAWASTDPGRPLDPGLFVRFKQAGRKRITAMNPRWEQADVDIELATLAAWDPAGVAALDGLSVPGFLPGRALVRSLVQLADPSFLIGPSDADLLRGRGFEVRTVSGAGHSIHRDDFDGFMQSLDGWI